MHHPHRRRRKAISADSAQHISIERGVSFEPAVDVVGYFMMSTDLVEQFEHYSRPERMNGNCHSLPPLTAQFCAFMARAIGVPRAAVALAQISLASGQRLG